MRAGVGMREWMTALDAICAWVNPGLVLVATALALLNLTVAAQRWTVVHAAGHGCDNPVVWRASGVGFHQHR